MKKTKYWVLTALLLLGAAGCADKQTKQESKLSGAIVSEDFKQGNTAIMKTEKGYYYYDNQERAFRYCDIATGKDMYLCNKPECKHDGNAFCVATNEKYYIDKIWLYSGRLFATAFEETDTQHLFKVLTIALDGSEMSEFATYMMMEKTGQTPVHFVSADTLYIHRNKAMIPMFVTGADGMEDNSYYGTAILDLDTREVTYLDEEPFCKENLKVQGISAYGDSIYYYKKEGRKNKLHRYNVTDGSDESYTLQPGFTGEYLILDEDNIVYLRSGNSLYLYHPSTGETEEAVKLIKKMCVTEDDGTVYEYDSPWYVSELLTDGTYIYVAEQYSCLVTKDESGKAIKEEPQSVIHVFNRKFEEMVAVNLAEVLSPEEVEKMNWFIPYLHREMSYLGEEIYFTYHSQQGDKTIYKCNRSDFLNGTPKFVYAYGAELQ